MIPEHRLPAHPGEILLEEFLRPLGLTQVEFAQRIGAPLQRINEIIQGKRGVTAETAWLLSQALGTSPELWLNLQSTYDLAKARPRISRRAYLAQKIWYLRCLIKSRDAARTEPGAGVHLVDDMFVVEIGDLTGSFQDTEEGHQEMAEFIHYANEEPAGPAQAA